MQIATSLGATLSLALTTAFGLVVAAALFGLVQLHAAGNGVRQAAELWAPRIEMVRELRLAIGQMSLLVTRQLQTTNFRHLAEIAGEQRQTEARLETVLGRYAGTAQAAGEAELTAAFAAQWADWREAHRLIREHLEMGEVRRAVQVMDLRARAAHANAERTLAELAALAEEEKQAAVRRADAAYASAMVQAAAAIGLGALIALVTVLWARRHIAVPVLDLAGAVRRLAAGDLGPVPHRAGRADEIGTLASAVAGYRDSLERGRELAAAAETERRRLEAAVANMPVGLCMADGDGSLVVVNDRFVQTYGLGPGAVRPDAKLEQLLAGGIASAEAACTIARLAAAAVPGHATVELPGDRVVSVVHQPLPGGGWVATHEDVSERRRAEARIAHMALHDALTGLPNRVLFREKIAEALAFSRRGGRFAVLYLDLDRFKAVNDTLGHPVGDALLRAVTARLQAETRETDTVARLGGDEFAIIQASVDQPAEAVSLSRRLVRALGTPFELDGHQVVIGTSIGIAMLPGDGEDADILLKHADLALYRAKSGGRGTWRFFEPEMDATMQSRRRLELDLRRALELGEFELFYQPILRRRSRQLTGFEALLRWRHPERGLVAPGEFIPLAEEIGLIVPLGQWVLQRACRDATGWPVPLRLAVNLSAAQFGGAGPVRVVAEALALSGLDPARLELEITETVVLEDTEKVLGMLRDLKALGVGIAMDDFGAGYCSLSYLRRFPFDRVKIDRSFVGRVAEGEAGARAVAAIADLCESLGMVVTAEGVETEAQLDALSETCADVQGFLFSAARPAAEVPALCAAFGAAGPAAAQPFAAAG